MVKDILRDELTQIRDKYGDDRLTEIQDVEDELDIEDLIEEEDCVFTVSEQGYVKRMPVTEYRSQKRGGRGVHAANLKEEDFVKDIFAASTHDFRHGLVGNTVMDFALIRQHQTRSNCKDFLAYETEKTK